MRKNEVERVADEDGVRINFIVPIDTNERLNKIIPKGSKGDVYRYLTEVFLDAIDKHGREFFISLLDGKCELVKKVQPKLDQIVDIS